MQHIRTGTNVYILLSPRETEVLRHLASGLANKEIAYRLHIEIGTVTAHVSHMMSALRLGNRVQLCRWALTHQAVFHGEAVDPGHVALPDIDQAA